MDRLLAVEEFLSGSTPGSLPVEPSYVSSSLGAADENALVQSHLQDLRHVSDQRAILKQLNV